MRQFKKHETHPGHAFALKQKLQPKSAHMPNNTGKQTPTQRFNDMAVFFGVEKIATVKLEQFRKLSQHRNVNVSGTRQDAADLYASYFRYFNTQERGIFEDAVALAVGVDGGSDVSVRDWLSVCVDCDNNRFNGAFLFKLPRITADDTTAEGLYKLLVDCGIDWKKVCWFVRDGASVMAKLGELVIQRLSPFMISIWCANHRMNLCFKACVRDDPDLWMIVDKLETLFDFFHDSPKNFSALKKLIPELLKGHCTPMRTGNLTRWTIIVPACESFINIFVYEVRMMVETRIKYPGIQANAVEAPIHKRIRLTEKQKNAKSKVLLNFFLDYRKICGVVFLAEVGVPFRKFHLSLETRSSDFTVLDTQLKTLKDSVEAMQTEEKIDQMAERVTKLILALREVPNIAIVEEQADIEVRVTDDCSEHYKSVLMQFAVDFNCAFQDELALRFPEDECAIVSAARIFDPDFFPKFKDYEPKASTKAARCNLFEQGIKDFGIEELETLLDWYGKEKKTEDDLHEPLVDAAKCREQWRSFKQWVRFRQLPSFSSVLTHVAMDTNKMWKDEHDQILKLMKIFKPKPNSSYENESVFAHHKEIVTLKRNGLSDGQVESLVKLSHESRRRYGDERYKTVDLIPAVMPYKTAMKKTHNKKAAERMQKMRETRKQTGQQQQNKKPKTYAQMTLQFSSSSTSSSASSSSSKSVGSSVSSSSSSSSSCSAPYFIDTSKSAKEIAEQLNASADIEPLSESESENEEMRPPSS